MSTLVATLLLVASLASDALHVEVDRGAEDLVIRFELRGEVPEAAASTISSGARVEIEYPIYRPHKKFKWEGVNILPTSFLVDADGVLLRRYVGALPEQIEGLKRDIDDVIHGRPLQPQVIPTETEGDPQKRPAYSPG